MLAGTRSENMSTTLQRFESRKNHGQVAPAASKLLGACHFQPWARDHCNCGQANCCYCTYEHRPSSEGFRCKAIPGKPLFQSLTRRKLAELSSPPGNHLTRDDNPQPGSHGRAQRGKSRAGGLLAKVKLEIFWDESAKTDKANEGCDRRENIEDIDLV